MKAPFPWFGGKSRVAAQVWERFGDVATYNEPFAGSLAVLLGRPTEPRVETVNDLDCYLANFWRALQADPDGVAKYADGPVNEADLHARHRWLVEVARPNAERCMREPDFYDVKIAGWWVWGQCLWIGSGWCQRPEWTGRGNAAGKNALFGINSSRVINGGGRQRTAATFKGENPVEQKKRPQLTRQIPQLSATDGGSNRGIHSLSVSSDGLYEYLRTLAARLRRVRVCCGDWKRVLTPSVTTYIGTTGVFLDPPYSQELRERCYSEDHDISADVRDWAVANGDNPDMRIALCGYEGEHAMPDTWDCMAWKAHGGYSRSERGKANRARERIWFSPNCLKPNQKDLFSHATV